MKNSIFNNNTINSNPSEQKNFDIAGGIRFLRDNKVQKLFEKLPDARQKSKVKYPISTLAMWAFNLCAFRQGSKNCLQTTLETLSKKDQEGFAKLLGTENHDIPHSSTVDYGLSRIPHEEINKIFLNQIDALIKKKLFYNHSELSPGNTLNIGIDGYWIHKYDHPHSVDQEGNNTCPYCLPRVHKRGTPMEKTYWVHAFVTVTLVAENFVLPLYIYPLKAEQVDVKKNDADLKQECELTAVHNILPFFRKKYPRLSMTFLGDALYANRPFLCLCEELKLEYMIVLKENLKIVNKKCDELSTSEFYQKHYTHKEKEILNGSEVKRKAEWFNNVALGEDLYTNVLRFEETEDVKKSYKGQWLCSKKLFQNNCFKVAKRARMRWNHEDFHNTCKNRGFNIRHDLARAEPNLLIVWKIITFLAFFFFELFRHTTLVKVAKKARSLTKFARDLLGELLNITWELIEKSPILQKKRVQFRFHFGTGP